MEKIGGIKSLSGFKKSHSIPDNKTHSTEIFVHTISSEELQDETQNISDRIKTSFGYKRKDISLSESDGQKSLLTPDFVIHVSINQSDENCREFVKIIRLTEISNKEIIKSEKFDSAFNGVFNSLIIRLDSTINIEKLIDDIEEVQDDELELHYPVNLAYCDLEVANIPGKIRVFSDEIVDQSLSLWDSRLSQSKNKKAEKIEIKEVA